MLELVAKACEGRGTQVNSSSYALHSEQIRFTIHSVLIEVIFGGLTEIENFLQSQDNCERCKTSHNMGLF